MPLIFENGIKFIFLLLLTGVYSRNHHSQWQDLTDREQSDRYHRDDDGSDWDQYYHNQVQIHLDPDQTERHQSHRGHSHHHQQEQNTVHRSHDKSYTDRGRILSRLLNSQKSPIVVLVSQNLGSRGSSLVNSGNNLLDSSADESNELFVSASPTQKQQYVPASAAENDAYILYNVLRTTQADEDLDPDAFEQFEKTKDMLRTAFALRCGQKSACEQKCPAKKPQCPTNCQKVKKEVKNECKKTCPERPRQCERKCEKVVEKKVDECEKTVDECEEEQEEEEQQCESKCQKVYDELDACPKPKKSCGPKCGKTMPPKWLLRFL